MARIEQTDDEAAVDMWARLRGVSVVLGKILTRSFTISELATRKVAPDQIRALKTATGRPINKDAAASLLAVRAGDAEHAMKLVSGLRNISPAVASLILEATGGLMGVCAQPVNALAAIKLPQKNRTVALGKTRAERIHRILHYKDGCSRSPAVAAPPAVAPPAVAPPAVVTTPPAITASPAVSAPPAVITPPLLDSEVEEVLFAAGFAA